MSWTLTSFLNLLSAFGSPCYLIKTGSISKYAGSFYSILAKNQQKIEIDI